MINKLKAWAIAHKQATIGICVAVAVVIAISIGYAIVNHKNATKDKTNNDPVAIKIDPKADDSWTDDSSPVILHVQSKDTDNDATSSDAKTSDAKTSDTKASDAKASDTKASVDFYHATSHGTDNDTVDLVPGDYTVTVVSPVNADGSIEVYANDNDAKSVAKSIDVTVKPVETNDESTASDSTSKKDTKSKDKPQAIEIPMVNVPADQVTDDQAKQIADETAKAVEKGDDTLKGDSGTSVLDKVNGNIKANPNVSDGTKDSVQNTSEQAKTETTTEPTPTVQPSKPSNDNTTKSSGSSKASSSSSKNSSSHSSQAPAPKSTRHWVDEQGHWENTTKQVWVPNVVTVPDYETKTIEGAQLYVITEVTDDGHEKSAVANGPIYWFYTKDDEKAFDDLCFYHIKNDPDKKNVGDISYWSYQCKEKTEKVQVGSHTEDHGHYETKVTGKKWVVDVAGHWED